jgi:16S rRNA (guanine966-N2)-methyltransferase
MSKSRARQSANQIRIIGGHWRGRKLNFPDAEGLRPTADRVRETLFNWLAGHMTGSRCLDMFAGSGALGFEALSRGASHCCFVDQNAAVLKQIQTNCGLLDATANSELLLADASKPIDLEGTFDIVFLDPPFKGPALEACLDWLLTSSLLKPDALIYIETAKNAPWHNDAMTIIKDKQAGDVSFKLAQLR